MPGERFRGGVPQPRTRRCRDSLCEIQGFRQCLWPPAIDTAAGRQRPVDPRIVVQQATCRGITIGTSRGGFAHSARMAGKRYEELGKASISSVSSNTMRWFRLSSIAVSSPASRTFPTSASNSVKMSVVLPLPRSPSINAIRLRRSASSQSGRHSTALAGGRGDDHHLPTAR